MQRSRFRKCWTIARASKPIDQAQAEVNTTNDDIQRAQSAHEMSHWLMSGWRASMKERPCLVAQQEIDDAHSRDLMAEAQLAAEKSRLIAARQKVTVTQAVGARENHAGLRRRHGAVCGSGHQTLRQHRSMIWRQWHRRLRRCRWFASRATACLFICQCRSRLSRWSTSVSMLTVRVPALSQTFTGKVARFSGPRAEFHPHHGHRSGRAVNPTLKTCARHVCRGDFATATRSHAGQSPLRLSIWRAAMRMQARS